MGVPLPWRTKAVETQMTMVRPSPATRIARSCSMLCGPVGEMCMARRMQKGMMIHAVPGTTMVAIADFRINMAAPSLKRRCKWRVQTCRAVWASGLARPRLLPRMSGKCSLRFPRACTIFGCSWDVSKHDSHQNCHNG